MTRLEIALLVLCLLLAGGWVGSSDYENAVIVAQTQEAVALCEKAIKDANRHAEILTQVFNRPSLITIDEKVVASCSPRRS
jgi:hypothetical protein